MENEDITLRQLRVAFPDTLDDVNTLLSQLSDRAIPLTRADLRRVLDDEANFVLVAMAGNKIVGMGTMIVNHKLTGTECEIEDVVVHMDYQRRGIARRLMQRLLFEAPRYAKKAVLTSNPRRKPAWALYESLGFVQYDTGVFHLPFPQD